MKLTVQPTPSLTLAERIAAAKARAAQQAAQAVAVPTGQTQESAADDSTEPSTEPNHSPQNIEPSPMQASPTAQATAPLTLAERLAAAKAAKQQHPAVGATVTVDSLHAKLVAVHKAQAQAKQQPEPTVEPMPTAQPSNSPAQASPALSALQQKLAAIREAQKAAPTAEPMPELKPIVKTESLAHKLNEANKARQAAAEAYTPQLDTFQFNEEQLAAIELAQQGKSFCLIGAAGTGKTTAVREIVRQVLANTTSTDSRDDPVALVSFTNRAVRNIRKALSGITETRIRERGLANCKTIHKLLAFAPKQYEVEVPNDKGGYTIRNTMRFEPTYGSFNTLPQYKVIIIDEASMLGLALFKQLVEACPNAVFIFIGDLNQLKPVMDDSILGYKLGELPVIELTRVYRQALESPIVGFQHRFTLAGKVLGDSSLAKLTAESNGALVFKPITVPRSAEEQARVFANAMIKHMDNGEWTPCTDAILLPNYKGFGSYWVSLWIAQELGRRRNAIVHEVQCTKHPLSESPKRYLAVGDFVIHGKEEYFIADIRPNAAYTGRALQPPSTKISRIGTYSKAHAPTKDVQDFESVLWEVESDVEQREVCSHFVTLIPALGATCLEDAQNMLSVDAQAITLNARKEVGELEFGYAITIHKSQGSEWRKVFLAIATHARNMRTRELLYTAMTRAKEELCIYYSPDSSVGANDNGIARCIRNQEIKGATWRDKVATFNIRREEYEYFMQQPTEYGVRN